MGAIAIALAMAFPARAGDWNSLDGDWFDGANWVGGVIPGAGDVFNINNGGTARIQAPGALADGGFSHIGGFVAGMLEISNGGTLGTQQLVIGGLGGVRVRDSGSELSNSGELRIGEEGTSTLEILAGGRVTTQTSWISTYGGSGTVTVSGSGSEWGTSDQLNVNGTLNVTAGGAVRSFTANVGNYGTGIVTISGSGSVWDNASISIGGGSTARVTVADGGMLSANSEINLSFGGVLNIGSGAAAGRVRAPGVRGGAGGGRVNFNHTDANYYFTSDGASTGTANTLSGDLSVTVAGGGKTTFASNQDYTGNTEVNAGTLAIGSGITVHNRDGIVGGVDANSGTVMVGGSGAVWTSRDLFVGQAGNGTLDVSAGGEVRNATGIVGRNGGTGTVTVSGANSAWINSADVVIGFQGAGALDISAGGKVTSATGQIGRDPGSTGTVTVRSADSLWDNRGGLTIGEYGSGTLSISAGGRVTSASGGIGMSTDSTGAVMVSGANSAWNIGGSMNVGFLGSGTLSISEGGTVTNGEGYVGAYNAGTVMVSGANSAWNSSGAVVIGVAAQGTVTVADSGTLIARSVVTLGQGVGGRGTLNIGNGGAAGLVSAAGGIIGDYSDGEGGGTVNFNHTDANYHFTSDGTSSGAANLLSGNLAVTVAGSGKTILTGDHTYYGGTQVNAGTLVVNGSIQGTTTVNSGGTLGGSGTVGNTVVGAGGTLAPGNSIGTLNVNGDLSFAPGSIYRVETDPPGQSDRINASGNVTINGGTVDVQAGGSGYRRNTRYTILSSGGALTGTFSSVTTNLAFLAPTLIYEGNTVQLELQNNQLAYAEVARTPSQSAVARYLGSFADAPSNAQAVQLIQQIEGLTAEQGRAAFESLAGTAHVSGSQAALSIGRDFSSLLAGRTGFSTGGLANTASAAARWNRTLYASADRYDPTITSDTLAQGLVLPGADADEASAQRGLWAQTLGSGGRIDTDGNAAGSRYRSNGFAFGYDQPVAERWVAGAAAGYGRSWWNSTSGSPASGTMESPQAGLYARYAGEGWRLRVDGTLASHSFTTDRTVTIGAASSTAHSKHSGREWSLGAQAETTIPFGDWQLKPVAGVRHTQLKESGFTETGSGPGNLTVAARTSQSTLLSAGMHFARAINEGKGQLELRAVASHLAGDVDSPVTASIAGQAGSFTANGVALKRNALALGASVSGQLTRNVNAYLDANYELRGAGQSAYRLTAGVRVAF